MHERSSLGRRIEVIILVLIVLLNLSEFFGWLPGDVDYIEKIVSWTAIAYIFYRVSLTRVFFGEKNKVLDLLIVASYFMLFLKDFIKYAEIAIDRTNYLTNFYQLILENAGVIEKFSFYAGGISIIILSLYFSFGYKIKRPSFLCTLYKGPYSKNFGRRIAMFFIIFLILAGFFVAVFNLVMEWLAIVLDAPLLIAGILFYIFIIVGRVEKFSAESFIYKIGKMGEGFYEKIIRAFNSKENLFLAVSGLLVLHLLTDISIFIIPYLTGVYDILFFEGMLAENSLTHQTIYILLQKDLPLAVNLVDKISIAWIYFFNVTAMLFLLITPFFIWYKVYRKSGFNVPRIILSLFFISVICFLFSPVFGIRPASTTGLVGVDIQTSAIFPEKISVFSIFLISLAIGFFVYISGYLSLLKSRLIILATALVQLFFGYYIYYFFIDSYRYYINAIILLYDTSQYFLSVYFGIFLAIILTFYAVGYIIFLSETVKEHKRIG